MNGAKRFTKALSAVTMATFLSGLSSVAQASEWYLGTVSDKGDRYFIDRQSIVQTGSTTKVNLLVVYQNTEDNISAAMITDEYNCSQNTARTLEMNLLYENGASKKLQGSREWRTYTDGSIGKSLVGEVCGN